jgi:photosystem II oxygen-evolving enhancer protein 1
LCSTVAADFPLALLQSANALSFDEIQGLTYLQVKGSGIANTCPTLSSGSSNIKDLKPGAYKLEKFCMEPTSFTVKEESQVRPDEGGAAHRAFAANCQHAAI